MVDKHGSQPDRSGRMRPRSQRGGARGAQKNHRNARVDELMGMGLSRRNAQAVAAGQRDLNGVLEGMATRDRARSLGERYGIPYSLATQIAMGHASLEQVLMNRRRHAHVTENKLRSVFQMALDTGGPFTFAVLGGRFRRMKILTIDPFEVDIEDVQTGEQERLHKLQVKYGFASGDWKTVRRAVSFDKVLRKKEYELRYRPQDRYHCSDKRLYAYLEAKTRLRVVTMEGDRFQGVVKWLGKYEFGFKVKGDVDIIVMRHALEDIQEL